MEAFQKVAAGLLVNVGTLSPEWVASMKLAARSANEAGHPWVLDPVGAGATRARIQVSDEHKSYKPHAKPNCCIICNTRLTDTLQVIESLLQLKPTLVRGNASEIMAVAGVAGASSKGVDSTAQSEEALAAGKRLAQDVGCVVAISGATDLVGVWLSDDQVSAFAFTWGGSLDNWMCGCAFEGVNAPVQAGSAV